MNLRSPYLVPFTALVTIACGNAVDGPGGGGSGTQTSSTTKAATATTTIATTTIATTTTVGPGTTTTTAASSNSSTASTGSGMNSGDCNSPGDCNGNPCVELTPGGFRVCQKPVSPATMCDAPEFDKCCNSMECAMGERCLLAPLVPNCGGFLPPPHNECAQDFCGANSPCEGGSICAPPGVVNNSVAFCLSAICTQDANCNAKPGGTCVLVKEPCCQTVAGLACVYPDGCRANTDCGAQEHCAIVDGSAVCVAGPPICPA